MLLELLQALKTAFETLLDATINQWLEIIGNVINDIVPTMPDIPGFSDFMTACIYTFVPYRAVYIALTILAPIYLYNLVINIIFFAKSFTPLGGD